MKYGENKSAKVWLFSNTFSTVWCRSIDKTLHLLKWMIIFFFKNFPFPSFETFLSLWFKFYEILCHIQFNEIPLPVKWKICTHLRDHFNCYMFDNLRIIGLAICSYFAFSTFIHFRVLVMLLVLLNFVRYYGIFSSENFLYL